MDYLYNKKRLTILDSTREDQTLWQTKKNSMIFITQNEVQPNLFINRIGCKLRTFFFSRLFKIRSKNTGLWITKVKIRQINGIRESTDSTSR